MQPTTALMPFATAGDPSTSDPAYFDLADKVITLAE
jgi:hypothetical protein